MKIEDLIELLNNRLREFKLSRDYARMNGDLERMNTADKEVIALEDTLFKLNLLIDTSKSAAVKEEILAEVITDGSVSVLDEYDITSYATDPEHERKIMNILSRMGVMDTAEKIDKYIKSKSLGSPVNGEMIMSATSAYAVDVRLLIAIMEQDSHFGTFGVAVRTLNPGNVGNDDAGNIRTYESWQEGVTAVAEWLSKHRGSTIIPPVPEPEPEPDTIAPIISDEGVTTTISTASVTWITDENATSKVEYATESMESASMIETVSDSTLVLAHKIDLSGLTVATTYFYRVTSIDEAGNTSTSSEMTFKTLSEPEPTPEPEPEPTPEDTSKEDQVTTTTN